MEFKQHSGRALQRLLAIALRYDRGEDLAPKVVARGQGYWAEKVLDLARANNVPIHSDRELSQLLDNVNVGEAIPPELYEAVARVLSYLYAVERKVR